jgi:predicted MPP superfamily phosphohydrolase
MANKRANQDAPAPRRTFSWIHLSDLHSTRDRRAFEQMNVLREMPADIERVIRDNGLRIDAIFFTGDASDAIYKGSRFAEKFAPATELLADIRQAAGAVSAERVFIVPGNHDIERDRIPNGLRLTWSSLLRQEEELKLLVETRRARRTREEAAQKLQECRAALKEVRQLVLEDTALEERWQDLVPAFAGYRNFLHDTGTAAHLMTNQPSKLQDRHFYCHRFEPQPDVTIEVVGFNSAWNCWNKSTHQKGQLHMGADWQLEYALNRLNRNTDDTVRLALLHHPPSWFWVTDTPLLEHQLPVDFDFCLHGHEHMSGQFLDLARSSARIAAGACYTHRDDMPGSRHIATVSSSMTSTREQFTSGQENSLEQRPNGESATQTVIQRTTSAFGYSREKTTSRQDPWTGEETSPISRDFGRLNWSLRTTSSGIRVKST